MRESMQWASVEFEMMLCAGRHCMGQTHSMITRVSMVVYIRGNIRGMYMHNASIRHQGELRLVEFGAAIIFE